MAASLELPPDPSRMNGLRARWAGAAVEQHNKRLGDKPESPHDQVVALLCNLQHWADRNGVDYADALEEAGFNYEKETDEGD